MKPDKIVVASHFLCTVDLKNGGWLITNAALGGRVYADETIRALVRAFETPRSIADFCAQEAKALGFPERALRDFLERLVREGVLFDTALGDEQAHTARLLRANVGPPPGARRNLRFELSIPWTLEQRITERRLRVLFFGACSVQVVMDVLRSQAAQRGLQLDGWATSFEELDAIEAREPELIIVGHLRHKNDIFDHPPPKGGALELERYTEALARFLTSIRAQTDAPILVLNVPTPTVAPLGIARQGQAGPFDKGRRLNVAITETVEGFKGAHVVDLDAELALHGKRWTLDDGLATFGHLGSLSWLAHRFANPSPGLEAYSIDPALIPEALRAGQLEHEQLVAGALLHHILVHLGEPRKKCVIVDLDGTLWPGVLADNGRPFVNAPLFDIYPYAVFLGLHSALQALSARGILLAVVSKNDEEVVKKLWSHDALPRRFFLGLEDFVTYRINWEEKVENIRSIAKELNIGLESLVFIDDHPVEREKVRRALPEVWVLGESPYETRWQLLRHPGLQTPSLTQEASMRGGMVRAQLRRAQAREAALDQEAFMRELNVRCLFGQLQEGDLDRAHELAQRTNQLNTTTRRWRREALLQRAQAAGSSVYVLRVEDRFCDYGLVGLAVTEGAIIESLLVSCRVLGLGVERIFLDLVLDALLDEHPRAQVRFLPSERNGPARTLLTGHGMKEEGELFSLSDAERSFRRPSYYVIERSAPS